MRHEHETLLAELSNTHPYLRRERGRYPLHSSIFKAIDDHALVPTDMKEVLLEWPHVANDGVRLAYTRNPAQGEADRQVPTNVGRYLAKCFPTAKANIIRDIAALYQGSGCSFTERSTDAYVAAVKSGPYSCMKEHGADDHPYHVYDPRFGWHMAINTQADEITGRCLCLENAGQKLFVRSYCQSKGDSYSGRDTVLEAWLKDQNYECIRSWPEGVKLALKRNDNGDVIAPYIDGNTQNLTVNYGNNWLEIDSGGDFEGTTTDGTLENLESCDDCGDESRNMNSTGFYGEHRVCNSCYENSYTACYGREGRMYDVNSDNTVSVGDDYYDEDYLGDNDIVQITAGEDEGDYAHLDHVHTDIHDEVWAHGDDGVVYLDKGIYEGKYAPKDETWTCAGSGEAYHDEDPSKEIDGERYHADFEIEAAQSELPLETPRDAE